MAHEEAEELITDELFVALTRPATVVGVPYMAAVFEVMLTFVLFIGTGYLRALFLLPAMHIVLYAITATDPGRLSSFFLGARTLLVSPNTLFWRATSFAPQRAKAPRKEGEGFLGV